MAISTNALDSIRAIRPTCWSISEGLSDAAERGGGGDEVLKFQPTPILPYLAPISVKFAEPGRWFTTVVIEPNLTGPTATHYFVQVFNGANQNCTALSDTPIPECKLFGLEGGTAYSFGAKACFKASSNETCSEYTIGSGITFPAGRLSFTHLQNDLRVFIDSDICIFLDIKN